VPKSKLLITSVLEACQSWVLSTGGNDFPGIGWHDMDDTEKYLPYKGHAYVKIDFLQVKVCVRAGRSPATRYNRLGTGFLIQVTGCRRLLIASSKAGTCYRISVPQCRLLQPHGQVSYGSYLVVGYQFTSFRFQVFPFTFHPPAVGPFHAGILPLSCSGAEALAQAPKASTIRGQRASNKIDLFMFTMTSISTNFDRTKTYPGESCPFFTGILRSLYFR